MRDQTKAIHAGYVTDPTTKSVAVPIYQTVAYEFDNAQHGADLFDLKVPGNIYTRIMNPTQDVLEKRVAAIEGGIGALALASGQALEAIAFNAAGKYAFDPAQGQVRLVYELDKNTFNGVTSLQLRVLHLEQ